MSICLDDYGHFFLQKDQFYIEIKQENHIITWSKLKK